MASNQLSAQARAVADAIRSGDIDEAARLAAELRPMLSGALPDDDSQAACKLLCEARKLAIVYRAQTMQALQSVVRQQLYGEVRAAGGHTFQIDG